MKIGIDAKRAFQNKSGLGNYSRDVIYSLAKKEIIDMHLFTPEIKNDFFSPPKNAKVYLPKIKLLKNFWRLFGVKKIIKKENIQIFHGLSNEIPIGLNKNIKCIVTIHDVIFKKYPSFYNNFDRFIYSKKTKYACKKANRIISVSEQTKRDLISYFNINPEKIEVIYQSCHDAFKTDLKNKNILKKYHLPDDFILYVGTIEERKNLLTILKTLKELPEYKLVIIGEGKSYKKKCLRFISKYNLSNRVFFLQRLTIKEMAAIYQSANIMIYPSVFEGFGIPIIEALFSRVPVITSKGSCFSEAGGPHSKYIDPLSVFEMKEAIIEIQKSSEKRKFMIENGIQYAKKFTDEKIAKNLTSIYNKIYC